MNDLSTQTILVGAGIVFIFFAIIGRLILPKMGTGPELTKWTRIILGIVGVILLASGMFIQLFPPTPPIPSPTPTPEPSPLVPTPTLSSTVAFTPTVAAIPALF